MKVLLFLLPLALSAAPVDFEKEILPILKNNCIACHGQTKPKAGLNLETPPSILKGGDSGPAVVPHDPDKSLLYISAAHKDPELIMPPKENKAGAVALNSDQLALLHQWIAQGATGQVSAALPVAWRPIPSHLNAIYAVAITADGQYAAAGRANRLHVYRLPVTAHEQLSDSSITNSNPWAAHLDTVNSLAFSPDGNLLASGGYREIKLWRRHGPAGKTLVQANNIEAAAVYGEHTAIVTNGVVAVWNKGTFDKILTATAEPVRALAFSPDGSQLAAAYSNNNLRVWRVGDGHRVGKTAMPANSIAWVDESKLAIGAEGIRIITLSNQAVFAELKTAQPVVSIQALSTNVLQAAFGDGSIQRWDVAQQKKLFEIQLKTTNQLLAASERKLAVAKQDIDYFKSRLKLADTNHVAAVARQKKAADTNTFAQKLFADKQTALTNVIAAKTNAVAALAKLEEESRKIVEEYFRAAATGEKEFAKAKAAFENLSKSGIERSKPLMDEIKDNPKKVAAAEKEVKNAQLEKTNAETELQLADAGLKKTAELLETAKNDLTASEAQLAAAQKATDEMSAKASANRFRTVAFSPSAFATTDNEGNSQIWSTNGALLDVVPSRAAIAFLGGKLILASSNLVELWDLRSSWKLEKTLGTGEASSPVSDRVNALCFSADGSTLISAGGEPSRGGEILIWNIPTGKLLRQFNHIHSDSVLALSISPNGKLLATGAADRFAKVTEIDTGKVVRTLEGHTHHVLGISWKADGRTLMTSGADNVIKVWDFTTGERRKNIDGFSKEVAAVAFLGVNNVAVAATENQVVLVNERGERPRYFSGVSDYVYSVAATASGDLIAVGNLLGTLYLWKSSENSPIARFPIPE